MDSPEKRTAVVDEASAGARLDKFLCASFAELSRSRIQSLIAGGMLLRNGQVIDDVSLKVKSGEHYALTIPAPAPTHMAGQDIPLSILYEDADLLVINKPAGLTVHPAPGHPDMTLANALIAHCGDSLSGIGGVTRPGIVHRLDKDTSGLMVAAKHDAAHRHLSAQLADRSLSRTYLAVCVGVPVPARGRVEGMIGRSPTNRQKMAVVEKNGKHAVTHYRVLESLGAFSLVECKLETGRTHQIRVHMAQLGHPLVGDPLYGRSAKLKKSLEAAKDFPRQALHAAEIGFIHPTSGDAMRFTAPLPEDMETLLAILGA